MTTGQQSTATYFKLPRVKLGECSTFSQSLSTTFYLSQLICIPRLFFFHIGTYVDILLLNYLMLRTHSYSWFWWGCFHNLLTNESDVMRIRAAGEPGDVDADRRPVLVDGSVVAAFLFTIFLKLNEIHLSSAPNFASFHTFLSVFMSFFFFFFLKLFQLFAVAITFQIHVKFYDESGPQNKEKLYNFH